VNKTSHNIMSYKDFTRVVRSKRQADKGTVAKLTGEFM